MERSFADVDIKTTLRKRASEAQSACQASRRASYSPTEAAYTTTPALQKCLCPRSHPPRLGWCAICRPHSRTSPRYSANHADFIDFLRNICGFLCVARFLNGSECFGRKSITACKNGGGLKIKMEWGMRPGDARSNRYHHIRF